MRAVASSSLMSGRCFSRMSGRARWLPKPAKDGGGQDRAGLQGAGDLGWQQQQWQQAAASCSTDTTEAQKQAANTCGPRWPGVRRTLPPCKHQQHAAAAAAAAWPSIRISSSGPPLTGGQVRVGVGRSDHAHRPKEGLPRVEAAHHDAVPQGVHPAVRGWQYMCKAVPAGGHTVVPCEWRHGRRAGSGGETVLSKKRRRCGRSAAALLPATLHALSRCQPPHPSGLTCCGGCTARG